MRFLLVAVAGVVLASCSDDASEATKPGPSADAGVVGDAGTSGDAADAGSLPEVPPAKAGWERGFAEAAVAVSCGMTEAQMIASGAPSVTVGGSRLFVGYVQAAPDNKNPLVARFDAGAVAFCESHEVGAPDGTALGVTWDGGGTALVVYTIDGGASGGVGFEGAATGKWLSSYGSGGGPKVTFVGSVDTATGKLSFGSFVIAKLNDGKTNSHFPKDAPIVRADGNVEIRGSSAFQPLNPDKSTMTCTNYPFDTRYVFTPDLASLVCSSSTNCTSKVPCP